MPVTSNRTAGLITGWKGSFMGKNFELLRSLNKYQEMFDTGAELSPLSPLQVTSQPLQSESEGKPVELKPLKLEMEEKERDEVMKFVHHVFFMPGAEAPRTVVLTSTEPGNGCSWICCRAAEILASQVKGPICVVDANLRSPGTSSKFRRGKSPRAIRRTRGLGVHSQFCTPTRPAELVAP